VPVKWSQTLNRVHHLIDHLSQADYALALIRETSRQGQIITQHAHRANVPVLFIKGTSYDVSTVAYAISEGMVRKPLILGANEGNYPGVDDRAKSFVSQLLLHPV